MVVLRNAVGKCCTQPVRNLDLMCCSCDCCAAGFYQNYEFAGVAVTFGFLAMFLLMGMSEGLGEESDYSIGKEASYSSGKDSNHKIFAEGSIASAAVEVCVK